MATQVIKIRKATPVTEAILITMVNNYRKAYNYHLHTSEDKGIITDALIEEALTGIEEDLSLQPTISIKVKK